MKKSKEKKAEKLKYGEGEVVIPPYVAIPDQTRTLSQRTDWGHTVLKPEVFWEKGNTGQRAVVFILDTAGDFDHPDLADRNIKELNFNLTTDPAKDAHGHGTHCAGIIAASNNGFGVVGLAHGAFIVAGKVLGDNGSGSTAKIAEAIRKVADMNLTEKYQDCTKIINMSFGSGTASKSMHDAIKYAISKGVRCVASAGNYGQNRDGYKSYPGSFPEVLSVAAIDKNKKAAYFTGKTDQVDLAAPGVGVYSTHKNGQYAYLSGTSMSGPYIAGLVALVETEYGAEEYSHSALETYLEEFTEDLGEPGHDDILGAGLPILAKYLENEPGQGDPEPEPEPEPTPEPDPDPNPIPPTRDKHLAAIKMEGESLKWVWRRNRERSFNVVDITAMLAEVETYLFFPDIYDYFVREVRNFPKRRSLIMPDGWDETEAVYYFTVFLGFALNEKFKFRVLEIEGQDQEARKVNPSAKLDKKFKNKDFVKQLERQEVYLEVLPERVYEHIISGNSLDAPMS